MKTQTLASVVVALALAPVVLGVGAFVFFPLALIAAALAPLAAVVAVVALIATSSGGVEPIVARAHPATPSLAGATH